MIDLKVLEHFGTTNERLREIFTATLPSPGGDDYEEKRADYDIRQRWEMHIASRLIASVQQCLQNWQPYGAVDVAWDSPPVVKASIPLMQYAQGKLNISQCAKELDAMNCSKYVKVDEQKKPIGIDLPAFIDAQIPLVRSMVTRRLAAQVNKYNSLYPLYRYQPRATTQVAKFYGDVISEVVEESADAYGYRQHDDQVIRDMFLYSHSVDFARKGWERDVQYHFASDPPTNGERVPTESSVEREGVVFICPHPTRVFKDAAGPWSSLNTDTGISYCGYWDVVRWGTIKSAPGYFNQSNVQYSSSWLGLFDQFPTFWRQYYCTVLPPGAEGLVADPNDATKYIGRYSSLADDAAAMIAVFYEKIRPVEYRVGTYPGEVWVRLVTAGTSGIVIASEILPSRPGAYCGYNESDNRVMSVSFAMEMMSFQDQLTNLYRQLLGVCSIELMKIVAVDKEVVNNDVMMSELRRRIQGDIWYAGPIMLEYSGSRYTEIGIDPSKAFTISQASVSPQSIQLIFQAIVQTVSLAERIAAMSPNEMGQPIVRGNGGVTATEAGNIEQSSSAVFNFASVAIDAFRSAKKRICFESWANCGEDEFEISVARRYPPSVVAESGLEIAEKDVSSTNPNGSLRWTVVANKRKLLEYDYVFSSRDGAERTVNSQAATILVQLVPMLQNPAIANRVPPEKLIEIVNEIFRQSGAGVDLAIDVDSMGQQPGEMDQMKQALMQVAQMLDATQKQVEQLSKQVTSIEAIMSFLKPQQPPRLQDSQQQAALDSMPM